MSRGAQPFPFRLVIFAPIWVRGLIIRPMGRLWIELSPVSTVSKDCPERMPDISLVVVPLFPVSRMPEGADSPCSPLPCIFIRSGVFSISIPILRKQSIVDRQSAPWRKFVTSVVPSARAPNMTARCDMDLSPGMETVPLRGEVALVSFMESIPFFAAIFHILCSGTVSIVPRPFPQLLFHKIPRAALLPQILCCGRCRYFLY